MARPRLPIHPARINFGSGYHWSRGDQCSDAVFRHQWEPNATELAVGPYRLDIAAQTNRISVGISTNWVNVGGSSGTNQVVIPIILTNGCVFYRLILP